MRTRKLLTGLLLTGLLLTGLLLTGCDSADCTLNNTVFCHYAFYNAEGRKIGLRDTLSVYAAGTDSVLYNRGVGMNAFKIPMSYYNEADTLRIELWGRNYTQTASFEVRKTNTEFFEGVDCPVNMQHSITSARVLGGKLIDSVVVIKPSVNFQQDENIRIYIHD